MLIDIDKCLPGCNACLDACRKENNVAYHGNAAWDVHRIRKVTIRSRRVPDLGDKTVPLMCNHCENPPCADICPVGATYRREDGIVVCDPDRCIGCRYCMIACPYNARHFNFRQNGLQINPDVALRPVGVAESCDFCAARLEKGKIPACVEICRKIGQKALVFGDLNDPGSDIAAAIRENSVKRLREDLGTEPKVYYIGL
jgi:molybdopterin-containing oxidoreductase family iron-sulfur binding subunit